MTTDETIRRAITLLADRQVRSALRDAWLESEPGIAGGHEEGGFILRGPQNEHLVSRWPRGGRNEIVVPPHCNGLVNDLEIVASFHTHPNWGLRFLQEPSETDRRAVQDDPDLANDGYLGEFVIARRLSYLVGPDGEILELGDTDALLFETEE